VTRGDGIQHWPVVQGLVEMRPLGELAHEGCSHRKCEPEEIPLKVYLERHFATVFWLLA